MLRKPGAIDLALFRHVSRLVMTARPTRIREIVEVPFAYPRNDALHETREFGELRAHVRNLVMHEYEEQARQSQPQST